MNYYSECGEPLQQLWMLLHLLLLPQGGMGEGTDNQSIWTRGVLLHPQSTKKEWHLRRTTNQSHLSAHVLQVKEYSQESSASSSCGLDVRKDEWGRRCHREVTWRTGFRSKRVTKGIVITRVEAIGGSLNWAMLLWLKTGSWHLGKTTEQVHNFLLFP